MGPASIAGDYSIHISGEAEGSVLPTPSLVGPASIAGDNTIHIRREAGESVLHFTPGSFLFGVCIKGI